MATEEFKATTEELFNNYVELRKQFKEQGFENVSLSFKEYLDFYIKYNEHGIYNSEFDPNFEDEEDEDLDDEEE